MSEPKDPRVLFAAERTLLAWNRTSVSLMAFGFVVERFGLFLQIIGREEIKVFQRHISFFVGESFVILAALMALYSVWQHRRLLRSVRAADIPEGYNRYAGELVNAVVGGLGLALSAYIARGFF